MVILTTPPFGHPLYDTIILISLPLPPVGRRRFAENVYGGDRNIFYQEATGARPSALEKMFRPEPTFLRRSRASDAEAISRWEPEAERKMVQRATCHKENRSVK